METNGGEMVSATNGESGDVEECKLFVGGVSWNTDQDALKEYFTKFGEVDEVIMKQNQMTGNPRGFGFVTFKSPETASAVLSTKEHMLDGRKLDIQRAIQKVKPKKIFIGGLDPAIPEEEVKKYMSQFGEVEETEFPFDRTRNQRRGFCFVTFKNPDSCSTVCEQQRHQISTSDCEVRLATVPKTGGPPGSWGAGAPGGFQGGRGGGRGGYQAYGRGGGRGGMGGGGRGGDYRGGRGGMRGGGRGRGGYGGYGGSYDYSQGWGGYGNGSQGWGGASTGSYGSGYDWSGYSGYGNYYGNQGAGSYDGYSGYSGYGYGQTGSTGDTSSWYGSQSGTGSSYGSGTKGYRPY